MPFKKIQSSEALRASRHLRAVAIIFRQLWLRCEKSKFDHQKASYLCFFIIVSARTRLCSLLALTRLQVASSKNTLNATLKKMGHPDKMIVFCVLIIVMILARASVVLPR
jgi:uncharacterized membrane protein